MSITESSSRWARGVAKKWLQLADDLERQEAPGAMKRKLKGHPPYRIVPLGNPTKPLCPCFGWPDHLPWCTWGTAMPSPP